MPIPALTSALVDLYLHRLPDFRGKWPMLRLLSSLVDGTPVRSRYGTTSLLLDTQDRTNRLGVMGCYGRTVADVVENLREGDCFIDVGANCGLFTTMAARAVGEDGLVIAFEPCLDTYVKLLRNIWLNSFHNVLCLNLAVGSVSRVTSLDVSTTGHSGRYAVATKESTASAMIFMADLQGLSALLEFIGKRRTTVKIDVEGYELAALKGLDPLIRRPETCQVIVEVDGKNLTRYGASPDALRTYMHDAGFAPSRWVDDEHDDEIFVRSPIRKSEPRTS